MLTVRVCWHDTLELITLFVNRVFRISALWFISQIHEKASLVKANKRTRIRHKQSKYIHFIHLMGKGVCVCVCVTTCPHWTAENKDWS